MIVFIVVLVVITVIVVLPSAIIAGRANFYNHDNDENKI